MSVETGSDDPMPTTGADAIDYGQFDHLDVEGGLLIFDVDDEEAWL